MRTNRNAHFTRKALMRKTSSLCGLIGWTQATDSEGAGSNNVGPSKKKTPPHANPTMRKILKIHTGRKALGKSLDCQQPGKPTLTGKVFARILCLAKN